MSNVTNIWITYQDDHLAVWCPYPHSAKDLGHLPASSSHLCLLASNAVNHPTLLALPQNQATQDDDPPACPSSPTPGDCTPESDTQLTMASQLVRF